MAAIMIMSKTTPNAPMSHIQFLPMNRPMALHPDLSRWQQGCRRKAAPNGIPH
jgi:hypothetical protein